MTIPEVRILAVEGDDDDAVPEALAIFVPISMIHKQLGSAEAARFLNVPRYERSKSALERLGEAMQRVIRRRLARTALRQHIERLATTYEMQAGSYEDLAESAEGAMKTYAQSRFALLKKITLDLREALDSAEHFERRTHDTEHHTGKVNLTQPDSTIPPSDDPLEPEPDPDV